MPVTSRKMPCRIHFPSNDRNPTCLAQGSLSLEATLFGEGFTNQRKAWFACLTQRSWKFSTLYQGSIMAQDSGNYWSSLHSWLVKYWCWQPMDWLQPYCSQIMSRVARLLQNVCFSCKWHRPLWGQCPCSERGSRICNLDGPCQLWGVFWSLKHKFNAGFTV